MVGVGEASYITVAVTIIADLFSADMRIRALSVYYIAIPQWVLGLEQGQQR